MEKTDENEIFQKNIKLAYFIAHRYDNYQKEKEDIMQIALESLWKAALKYDKTKGEFSTLACKIMTNNINSYLKRNRKYNGLTHLYDKILSKSEELAYIDVIADDKDRIDEAEDKILIQNCIKSLNLTGKEKDVFEYWMLGKKQEEIAAIVNTSQAQVSRIIARIIIKMKNNAKLKE